MKKLSIFLIFITYISNAYAGADANAPTVQLLKSCSTIGGIVINNCFTETSNLTSWMKNVRKPNISAPLKVNIGVGTFDDNSGGGNFKLKCDNEFTGYTSFIGSGSLQTIMKPSSPPVSSNNCTHLNFSDFKISTIYHYISWIGGGESRWSNMEIATGGGAWTETRFNTPCSSQIKGKHYWFSSHITFGSAGYTSSCDDTWFMGSEITLTSSLPGNLNHPVVLKSKGQSEIHVYGGNIRALGFPGEATNSNAMIKAIDGGSIHIHGTGIDLLPTTDAINNMSIFYANTGSTIHANSNAYAIQFTVGNANISRIVEDGGSVVASYNWGALLSPPPLAVSKTGSDTFIETDCNSLGICVGIPSIEQQPHQMLFDQNCNINGTWRDTTTNQCRN